MRVAHLTTVDMSLRYLVLPQLQAATELGEAIGISAPGEHVAEIEAMGIRHIPLPASTRGMDLTADLRATVQLWRVLRRERIDILHTHNPKPGVYGRIVGGLAGVPIVVNTVHGLYATPESPLAKRMVVYGLEWLAARFSDAELVQNPEDLDLLSRLRIVPAQRLHLLGNGVDLTRFSPATARAARVQVRAELGVDDETVVVGMVGRLVAEKGLPELMAAMKRLDHRYLLVVAGPEDPGKRDALPAVLVDEARGRGARFLGHRRDVERLYGAFDMFVLPSHREGFPRAAMEAAASGLPVVATDIRGCRQVVDDGVNGFLVPVNDAEALAFAIRRLGEDPGLRQRMGEASVGKATSQFDEAVVVERVITTYRRVAAAKGLGWKLGGPLGAPAMRRASSRDAASLAQLHRFSMPDAFLPVLGPRLLTLLYRAMTEAPGAWVVVAEVEGEVIGFVAGVASTADFYRWFIRKHWLGAVAAVIPALVRPRVLSRVLETLRYGSGRGATGGGAELLAMAVAPAHRGRGIATGLISELQSLAVAGGTPRMRVVVGAANAGAIEVYRRSGFGEEREVTVHAGEPSLELTWTS